MNFSRILIPKKLVLRGIRHSFPRSFSSNNNLDNTLIITPACAKKIQKLRALAQNQELKLRVTVEGGGCAGFQYIFRMDDQKLEEDMIFEKHGSAVVTDPTSFDLIRGSTVDFQEELIRNAFAVVNNPLSESACGCGSSFAVKAFSANPAID